MKLYVRPILVIACLALLLYLALQQQASIAELEAYLATLDRPFAATIFLTTFILGSLLLIPASIFMIASGAVFGIYWGYLFSMLGFTCGALLSFLFSRHLIRDFVSTHLPLRVLNIINSLHQHGWKLVATLRIFGMVPAALISYAMGVTNIKTFDYLWATFVFSLPIGFLFTYAGSAGKELIASGELQKLLFAFAALIILVISTYFIRRYILKKKASL